MSASGMPGLGVMIGWLSGNSDSVAAYNAAIGKHIDNVLLFNDALMFSFTEGSGLVVEDKGQSCCENRYMTTDDNLEEFRGAKLMGLELKEAPDADYEYGEHEVQFLEVKTDRGVFTMASHNEHNGYYGGFHIVCSLPSSE